MRCGIAISFYVRNALLWLARSSASEACHVISCRHHHFTARLVAVMLQKACAACSIIKMTMQIHRRTRRVKPLEYRR